MSTFFHGTYNEFTKLTTDFFGEGAFQRLDKISRTNYTPCVYLTSSKDHAAVYGEKIYSFDISVDGIEVVSFAQELEEWAADQGYNSAQEMINDYYDGSIFDAMNADQEFEQLVRRAISEGKPAIIADFGDLYDTCTGRKFKAGQVVMVIDPSIID
ncbi:TPA: hypothetical protein R8E83_003568 [Escherichia coli]|nr:hypothetical protein [Escherichia coli]